MKLLNFFRELSLFRLKKVLVFAHFHPLGILRKDTEILLCDLTSVFDKIIFVSTNINADELVKIPRSVEAIVRENNGYDFYSYKIGIEKIFNSNIKYSQLTLMNSSFLCVDTNKLINFYFSQLSKKFIFCGLTKSYEGFEHIQSYFMTFQKSLLENPAFQNWWRSMTPLNVRQDVVEKYEKGLSAFISSIGIDLNSVYHPLLECSFIANPTHAHYFDLMEKSGVLKIEVFKSNPFKLNLQPLNQLIREDEKILGYIRGGLEN